jgi:type I restriction enzyme S subunit
MHFDQAEFERYRLHPGDLLLNEGQTPELLGRPAIYRGTPADVAFTNSLIRFQARDGIDPRWALAVFRHHMHAGRFTRESRITTNIAHLSAARFKTVEFPVPPLDEQRRIVEILEDHLSRLDAATSYLRAACRRAQALLPVALAHVLSETSGRMTTLGAVAKWGSGGTPTARNPAFYQGGTIPWLNSGDLTDGPVAEVPKRITDAGFASSSVKWVPPGSLLIAMYGATIGRVGVTTFALTTNQAVAFAQPGAAASAEFLFWYLRSQRPALVAAGKGGAQPNISQSILKEWPVVVPSLFDQHAFVTRAQRLQDGINTLSQQERRLAARAKRLRRSLLAAAFTGRLTGVRDVSEVIEELAGV